MKALAIVAMLAATAHAEDLNFGALEDDASVTTVTTGVEHGLVVGVGAGYVTTVADRQLVLAGDLALDAADARDVRVRVGALAPIVSHGAWRLIGGAAVVARNGYTDVAQMIDVGGDFALLAGRYSRRWFAAGEVGFDWAIATHLDHTDAYRMLIYADARDGWYRNTGGLLRTGVQGGVSFGKSDVVLRAGVLRDTSGTAPLVPFYGTLAYDRRW